MIPDWPLENNYCRGNGKEFLICDNVSLNDVNLAEWRAHLLERLRRQIEVSADSVLAELLNELSSYPQPGDHNPTWPGEMEYSGVAVPLQLTTENGILSFVSTTTVFGTPVDITLSEVAMESFFPADDITSVTLSRMLPRDEQK